MKRMATILVVLALVGFVIVRNSSKNSDHTYTHSTGGQQMLNPSTTPSASTAPSEIPTVPPTQAPTEPPTQPTTQPPVTEPLLDPDSPEGKVAAFEMRCMAAWTNPLKASFEEVVGSRTFASSRGGGARAHAGLDFVAPHGTRVYAITSGTVRRVAPFFENTWAVEVINDDGSLLRYCEIETALQAGDRLNQGQLVGTILRAEDSKTEMLHMEVYYGDAEGALTQSSNREFTYVNSNKNFMRRCDLMDPTFLKDLPVFGS